MSTSISLAFPPAKRKKPLATYGKSSRAARTLSWNDDAPAPDRPHKTAGASAQDIRLRKPSGLSATGSTLGSRPENVSGQREAHDIFDIPSDDELGTVPAPAPAKKPAGKAADVFDVPSSDEEETLPQRRRVKTPQTVRKRSPMRQPAIKEAPRRPQEVQTTSSDGHVMPFIANRKLPAVGKSGTKQGASVEDAPRLEKSKPVSQVKATAVPMRRGQTKIRSASDLPSQRPTRQLQYERDVFDVPSSDDEVPARPPRRQKPITTTTNANGAKANPRPSTRLSSVSIESDDSNTAKKRKREVSSQSSTTNGPRETHSTRDRVAPRSSKFQRKDTGVSARDNTADFQLPAGDVEPGRVDSAVNETKRTRLRTAARSTRPSLVKNQTSPAHLHGMLAVRSFRDHSAVQKVPDLSTPEDVTMYDIPEPATLVPKVSSTKHTGSITPRQKELLSNLLGGSSDATSSGMPSIRRLQLTDRKPTLARSSSDIPQTSYSRKTRLIDTLVQAAESTEEEESDEETEEGIVDVPKDPGTNTTVRQATSSDASSNAADDMKVDTGAAQSQSQSSQNTLHANSGSRFTYARQRSYRQESDVTEGLLLAMDFDEPLGSSGFSGNNKLEPVSEDEDDPASQVRGIHELRRQGENQKFQMEAQTSIDDIADKTNLGKSIRRSALLDFCTRMADRNFLELLLESALVDQFIASIGYTGEVIFDFAACVASAFVLEARPDPTILDEFYKSDIVTSLAKLLVLDADISRIAKERMTNLSKLGRESVENFRAVVQTSSIWSPETLDKVTPQIVALKTLELLVLGLRKVGRTEALLNEDVFDKVLHAVEGPCERLKAAKETSQDVMTLNIGFSIMEAMSLSTEKQSTWSNSILQRLADATSVLFSTKRASPIKLATRLCILLTNNKPKACEIFAGQDFVKPLVSFINHMFTQLACGPLDGESEVRENLILSLGAMINIAEFSDKARISVLSNGDELLDALANTFLEGSERAAHADSMEESYANVPIGYLTVLLGNLCLNDAVRSKIRSRLPGRKLDLLVEKVKEFVTLHERVDRMTDQFEGDEGREVSQNYTRRLIQVVRRLEQANV